MEDFGDLQSGHVLEQPCQDSSDLEELFLVYAVSSERKWSCAAW